MSVRRLMMASAAAMFLWAGAGIAAQKPGETIPATVGDLASAQLIEVRDQHGEVMLHGTLKTSTNKAKTTERKADLVSPTGQKAKGKVAIDIDRKDGVVAKDEISASIYDLPKMTEYQLFVDGQHVTTFMTSKDGRAELRLDRKADR